MICTNCNINDAIHNEGEKALCRKCMDMLELSWNNDSYEFVDSRRDCVTCGGTEVWCNACQTYDCPHCNPYGTCGCS